MLVHVYVTDWMCSSTLSHPLISSVVQKCRVQKSNSAYNYLPIFNIWKFYLWKNVDER